MNTAKLKYKRILLKLSGEALMGKYDFGIDREVIIKIVNQIKEVKDLGVQIAIVIGGGNIFRGVSTATKGMNRATADYMGMLATLINSLALKDAFQSIGVNATIQSALTVQQIAQTYARPKALHYLDKSEIVIFGAGTGNPFFTTDTAAALRGMEMECEVILKATNVDGIYDSDPKKNPNAIKYDSISFKEVIEKDIKVMDTTAFTLCREEKINIIVFPLYKEGTLKKIILGENIGTLVYH